MFTESARIRCSILTCCCVSAEYQTCIWHHPLGNSPVLSLYGVSDTFPVLSYTVTILSGSTSLPVVIQYKDTTAQQAVHTKRLERKPTCCKIDMGNSVTATDKLESL